MVDFRWKHGELSYFERKLLYKYVKKFKPETVFEIGSGYGGSSYFILHALRENKKGVLYTCDPRRRPDPSLFSEFADILYYSRETAQRKIWFLKRKKIIPDFLFFDGDANPNHALDDFHSLQHYVKAGTIFSMHDWGEQATKAALLRPYLHSLRNWKIICEPPVNETLSDKYTVGIVFAQKLW